MACDCQMQTGTATYRHAESQTGYICRLFSKALMSQIAQQLEACRDDAANTLLAARDESR